MVMKKKKCNSSVQLVYKFYAIYNRTDKFSLDYTKGEI